MYRKFLIFVFFLLLTFSWTAEIISAAKSFDNCWLVWSSPEPGGTLPPNTGTSAIAFFWNDTVGMQGGTQKSFTTGSPGGIQREVFDPPPVVQGQPWNCRPNDQIDGRTINCDEIGFKYCLLWNIGPANNNSCSIDLNPPSGPSPLSGTLTWTTSGTLSSCTASGGWSGNKSVAGGSEPYGPIIDSTIYSLDCAGIDGPYYDASCSSQAGISATPTPTPTGTPTPTPTSSPPMASGVTVTEPDYCVSGPAAAINWHYNDPDADAQSTYQVQIDDSSSFASPVWDSGIIPQVIPSGSLGSHNTVVFGNCATSNPSGVGPGTCRLTWNTGGPAYQARVKVWDSNNKASVWANQVNCNGPGCQGGGSKWKTPQHAHPQVNFSWSPASPNAGQNVQFTDATVFSDGSSLHTWLWNFGDGTPNSSQRNPIHNFATNGVKSVTLTATDSDSYTCSISKPVGVQEKAPWWKEILPR